MSVAHPAITVRSDLTTEGYGEATDKLRLCHGAYVYDTDILRLCYERATVFIYHVAHDTDKHSLHSHTVEIATYSHRGTQNMLRHLSQNINKKQKGRHIITAKC